MWYVSASVPTFVYVVVLPLLSCFTHISTRRGDYRHRVVASWLRVSSHYILLHLQSFDCSHCVRRWNVMEHQHTNRLTAQPEAFGLASESGWLLSCKDSFKNITHFCLVANLFLFPTHTHTQIQIHTIRESLWRGSLLVWKLTKVKPQLCFNLRGIQQNEKRVR